MNMFIIFKHRAFNIKTYIVFMDFRKTFDWVSCDKLLGILELDHLLQFLFILYITFTKNLSFQLKPTISFQKGVLLMHVFNTLCLMYL